MNHYRIRFNRSRGQPGRGSIDHVWRVFENQNEFLVKHVIIDAPSWTEQDGEDWNVACDGYLKIKGDVAVITYQQA
jgi:uncharacterized protein CbrC (UPF0167 family)